MSDDNATSLSTWQRRLLFDAPGMPIDPNYEYHTALLELESLGYLRRVVSFNRRHYRGATKPGHRYCWTRTELGEILASRLK